MKNPDSSFSKKAVLTVLIAFGGTCWGAGWSVKEENDRMTGETSLLARLASSSAENAVTPPVLFIRCQKGKTSIQINWGVFIDLPGEGKGVNLKFDDESVQFEIWKVARLKEITFYPKIWQRWQRKLANKIVKSETVLAKITPYDRPAILAEFDTQRNKEALEALAKECKW